MNSTMKQLLREYLTIFTGCAIYALSFNAFFLPNNIAMGGLTGISQVVNRLIPVLPIGGMVIVLNIPLFYASVRKQGWKILIHSLTAMAISNVMIDGLANAYSFPPCDLVIAAVFGGALTGISMGLMMTVGATTGGTELLARLLKYKIKHLSIGRLCMIIDLIVVTLYSLTFHCIQNGLYGIIAMYISSIMMDIVVYGANDSKMAYVISDRQNLVEQELLKLDFGVTLLEGHGAWSGSKKSVMLCAFKKRRFFTLKQSVIAIDPDAFIIVCNAHEILGQGFDVFSEDSI